MFLLKLAHIANDEMAFLVKREQNFVIHGFRKNDRFLCHSHVAIKAFVLLEVEEANKMLMICFACYQATLGTHMGITTH